ncbi:Glyoxylase, beta-lactamase superfamily II [Chryseobacterium oleae]|uniref:Glyoxylase, beta-lactamase superfamily II n=1 Tax=Chryseobacterium oleae TaxID=491207 RepID=A0A1I4YRI3_CHROL|nr:MBL fold metallo-hydrolase [Chryseobacterium oleae]SFN40616.1 Glyoxylase, beta-lactamase superfamily II [Chryseobacterium oleae]
MSAKKKLSYFPLIILILLVGNVKAQLDPHLSGPEFVDKSLYDNHEVLEDIFGKPDAGLEKTLIKVKGNLYRHTNGTLPALHSGLVLITHEGAIVIDPALTQAAIWLKDEIKKKFNVPVKYVILTHAHYDHAGGSQVFQQAGAKIIIHKNGLEPIIGEKLPVAVPDIIYDKQLTIKLGGETVIVKHIAPSHSNSMSVVLFPQYKALQLTDVGESKTMPYNDFLDFYYDGWIETLDWALKQDVDYIDVGHYTMATLDDIREEREYIVSLHQQVLNLVREGQSWDQLYRNVKFTEEVKKWGGFDAMNKLNILGMFRWVSNHRRGVW